MIFTSQLEVALMAKQGWFNTERLQSMLEQFRLLFTCVRNLNEVFVCLVGNKIDLNENRVIEKDEAEKYVEENNLQYFEVSAKTGEGINELFEDVTNKIMNKILKKNEKEEIEIDENPRMSFLNKGDFETKEKKCCLK